MHGDFLAEQIDERISSFVDIGEVAREGRICNTYNVSPMLITVVSLF